MSSMLDMMIDKMKTNQIQQTSNSQSKEPASVNIVNQMSMNLQQPTQTTNKVSVPKQDTIIQDTFEKNDKDKTKKIIKYSAIGTGIVAIAYSIYAITKYGYSYGSLHALVEPINRLKTKFNPNWYTPKISIEENELEYIGNVSRHLIRLNKQPNLKKEYLRQLYEKTSFTEQGRLDFLRHYGHRL